MEQRPIAAPPVFGDGGPGSNTPPPQKDAALPPVTNGKGSTGTMPEQRPFELPPVIG